MEKLTFNITIDAPRERVWERLWNDESYREWTSVFSPGSKAQSDWNEGSKILFLDGKNDGMIATIAAKRPPSFMSFKTLGEVQKGIEDVDSEKVKQWAGSLENYTLKDVKGKTELTVELDVTEEFKDYMAETWPQALEKLKSMVESKTQDFAMNQS